MNTQLELETAPLIDLAQIKKKTINLALFGHGNVGAKLIDQIIFSKSSISKRRDLELNIFAIANSGTLLLRSDGASHSWRDDKENEGSAYSVMDVIHFAKLNGLENLIAVDNTASLELVDDYPVLVENGFNLISSNKIGNTLGLDFYKNLRNKLSENKKEYLYETNVGAGLPLIDTIKLLHLSGENITRIKGVFSGSLSYVFNTFSEGGNSFGEVLQQAIGKGFTEPDPREDLCGNDVGRKLLILARELDLHNEFEDIEIQNLIPENLQLVSKEVFLNSFELLNQTYQPLLKNQKSGNVLRYVGDLHGDLSKSDGAVLEVKLVSVPKNSMLGQLSGSDSLFEIYTESYGEKPIVIQGAGAGAAVTARGVFGDILRLCDKIA